MRKSKFFLKTVCVGLLFALLGAGCSTKAPEEEKMRTEKEKNQEKNAQQEAEDKEAANKEEANKEDNSEKEDVVKGFDTEEELLFEFIKCCNSGELSDRFWQACAPEGSLAYWMLDDGPCTSLLQAFQIVENREKGGEFIAKVYPDYVEAWEQRYNKTFSDEEFKIHVRKMEDDVDGWVSREEDTKVIAAWQECYGISESQINDDRIFRSDYGYYSYRIPVNDPKEYITAVQIRYCYKDGKFFWLVLNDCA